MTLKNLILIVLIVPAIHGYGQELTEDTVNIEEVVVTSTKTKTNRNLVPTTISVVSEKDLKESHETALLPVLSEQTPGLFVTERGIAGFGVAGGAAGQINMRGLGGSPTSQVLVLLDGHPQFMGMMGHPLPDAYAASQAERVEIIRGPASILYGSNAMGGVINIITKKSQKEGIRFNSKAAYGSHNTQKFMQSGGYKKGNLSIFSSLNYDKTDGHRDSSDFNQVNGYLKIDYDLNENIKLTADYNLSQFESQDPGVKTKSAGDRIDILRGKSSASIENNYKNFDGAIKGYFNFGEHNISDGWQSVDEMYGLMIYEAMRLFKGNSITIGYDYMKYGGKGSPISTVLRDEEGNIIPGANGPQFQLSPVNDRWINMENQAGYAFIQQTLMNRLTLSAGIRYDMSNTYGNEWIPQGGFSYRALENTVIKGSVAKGYRPPSLRELFLFPPANETLKPEKMMNYELGWHQKWFNEKLNTEITGYISDGENRIVMVPVAPPPPPQYKNTGAFYNTGIELASRYHFSKNLNFHMNYSYIDMKEPLIATPEQNLFVSGNYSWKDFGFKLKIAHIRNLYGEKSGNIEVIENQYSNLGARVKYQIDSKLDVFISGDNLLNEKYAINYGYPMPGATFMTGINLNY